MHRSPSHHLRGKGRSAGGEPAPRRAGRRLALAVLAVLAGLLLGASGPAPAQAPLPQTGEAAPVPAAGGGAGVRPESPELTELGSALAAEPIPVAAPRRELATWTIGLLLGGIALLAAGRLVMWMRQEREYRTEGPLLVFPEPRGPVPAAPPRLPAAPGPRTAPPRPVVPGGAAPGPRTAHVARPAPAAPPPAGQDDELTVRLELPLEGRLQFLPGALEVVEGGDPRREIRFMRAAADEAAEYTLGRTSGTTHRHIQLAVPTVSRLHARMRFDGGSWRISNLSSTNPLRVNGRELADPDESRVLADGDRIQIGEMILRFRAPVR